MDPGGHHVEEPQPRTIRAAAAGDQQAFEELVRTYQAPVWRFLRRLLGDAALAEDVAQEALTRAWRHAQAFDPRKGAVATWLLTITRNLAVDALRMRRSDPRPPGDLADMLGASNAEAGPAETAVARDEGTAVRVALRLLPAEQRRALILSAFHGRTAREIAELEGIPLGTAKTRIRAGLMRLRSVMTEEVAVA